MILNYLLINRFFKLGLRNEHRKNNIKCKKTLKNIFSTSQILENKNNSKKIQKATLL